MTEKEYLRRLGKRRRSTWYHARARAKAGRILRERIEFSAADGPKGVTVYADGFEWRVLRRTCTCGRLITEGQRKAHVATKTHKLGTRRTRLQRIEDKLTGVAHSAFVLVQRQQSQGSTKRCSMTKVQYDQLCQQVRTAHVAGLGQVREQDWFPSNDKAYRRLVLSVETTGLMVREVLLEMGELACSTTASLSMMSIGAKWFVLIALSRDLDADEIAARRAAGAQMVIDGYTLETQEVS